MKNKHNRHGGFALIIVLASIALAAVLGYAMLTTASLSSEVDKSTTAIATSDTLAESGVELAAYYLQHPESAPTLNTDGYWPGGTNISLGGTLKIDKVTVTQTSPKNFAVIATATSGGTSPARSVQAKFYVESSFIVKNALSANGSVDLSRGTLKISTANAADTPLVRVDGTLQVAGSLLGTVVQALSSTLSSITAVPTYPAKAAPTLADLSITASLPNYTYNGNAYVADELTDDPGAVLQTTHPATNPANVWYSTSSKKVQIKDTILNGTLIMTGSNTDLELSGAGTLKVRPVSGMPALVVAHHLKMTGTASLIDAEGLVWVGQELSSANGALNILTGLFSGPVIRIKGAMMLARNDGLNCGSGYRGELNIIWCPDNLTLKDFSNVGQTPTSVKVLGWQ